MGVFNPGEDALPGDPGPDQATVDQMNAAVGAGYSYGDIAAYHEDQGLEAPPRPPLDAIMSGQDLSQAQNWAPASPFIDTGVDPHVDAINEGAGPIGEAILGAAAGGAVGVLKGAAEGITEGVLTDVAGAQANPLSRAAQLGVETSTEELGTKAAGSATIEGASAKEITQMVVGNKWTRRIGAAIAVGEGAFDVGKKSGKE